MVHFRSIILAVALAAMAHTTGYASRRPKPKTLLVDWIRGLEERNQLKSKEVGSLAWTHAKMGEYYRTIALTTAHLTLDVANCYLDNTSCGVQYFGTLAALELGKDEDAVQFIKSTIPDQTPQSLKSLSHLLFSLVEHEKSGKVNWKAIALTSRWDSLEAVCQQYRLGNELFPLPAGNVDGRDNEGVDLSPLVSRAQLATLLNNDNLEELRKLVREIDRNGPSVWQMSNNSTVIAMGDPALVGMMSKAHFRLAEADFGRFFLGTKQPASPVLLLKYLDVGFRQGKTVLVDSLARNHAGDKRILPYLGWLAWKQNDPDLAWKYWNECLDPALYQIATNMLRIWSSIPAIGDPADSLRVSLTESMGGQRDVYRLGKSQDGKRKILNVYKSIGAWFFENSIFDSASIYYRRSRPTNDPVGLRNYSVNQCVEYYAAQTMSGAEDFRQEGYQGWLALREYFPSTNTVLEPLSAVILCEAEKYVE